MRTFGTADPFIYWNDHFRSRQYAVFKSNFKTDLSHPGCWQRSGDAVGREPRGLTIKRAAGNKLKGHVCNPFNEYECGSYFVRALASYGLLGALGGFRYSAATRTLQFSSVLTSRPLQIFFCAAEGFGTIILDNRFLSVEMVEGQLQIDRLELTNESGKRNIEWRAIAETGSPATICL